MKNTIKVERARQNITQDDLAKAVKVSRQTINAVETGKFIPSTVLALKLAVHFNINVNELFQLEDHD